MKRKRAPKRFWDDARAKVDREGVCRHCGRSSWEGYPLEAAHIIGRVHDLPRKPGSKTLYVHPSSIVPLCRLCHGAQHRHEIDLLPDLHLDEQLVAVSQAGGIEQARVRLAPSQYREARAA